MLSKTQVKTAVHRWYKAYPGEELRKLKQQGDLERVLEQKAQAMLSEWNDPKDQFFGRSLSQEEIETQRRSIWAWLAWPIICRQQLGSRTSS